ncbi:hypothetical protein HanRHA438_Chr01g0015051 [Helianthus annuus]|nr:hypothetical protein HanRHA438_Chr01g0015051 [Helianthus annuus]
MLVPVRYLGTTIKYLEERCYKELRVNGVFCCELYVKWYVLHILLYFSGGK